MKYNHVYFLCQVKNAGNSSIDLSWSVNGKPVGSRPPPYKLSWKQGGILLIRPLFVGKANGFYECIAKDSKGTTLRKGFNLTVVEGQSEDLMPGHFLFFCDFHLPFIFFE